MYPESPQRGGGKAVVPRIGGESQMLVRLHRIHSAILQFVRAQFIHQADTAALLRQIEKDTRPSRGDLAQRQLQLSAAVAALRAQHVSGKALGVNPNQRY